MISFFCLSIPPGIFQESVIKVSSIYGLSNNKNPCGSYRSLQAILTVLLQQGCTLLHLVSLCPAISDSHLLDLWALDRHSPNCWTPQLPGQTAAIGVHGNALGLVRKSSTEVVCISSSQSCS